MRQYYVYIMTNKSKTLYTGVTNNLERRAYEHKQKIVPGFTSKYKIDKLVYYEVTPDVKAALVREKQIKGWLRSKKIALIEVINPDWKDLSAAWFEKRDSSGRSLPEPKSETLRFTQGDKWRRAPSE